MSFVWKQLCIDDEEFLLKMDTIEVTSIPVHEITLTNFNYLWYEQITEENLIQRCKDMNPLFEAKPKVFIKHVLSLLDTENPNIVRHLKKLENQIILKFETRFDNFKFQFNFNLQLQPSEFMYKVLTVPMLMMIVELQRQKKLLTSLLAKKDVEIAQYKFEGADLIRKSVQTQPFNEDDFTSKCIETLPERKEDVEQHPTKVFTHSTTTLYHQVTTNHRLPTSEGVSTVEQDMENTVDILLKEKRLSPKKRRKPKALPVSAPVKPTDKMEVRIKNEITEVAPAKKSRVFLKNL